MDQRGRLSIRANTEKARSNIRIAKILGQFSDWNQSYKTIGLAPNDSRIARRIPPSRSSRQPATIHGHYRAMHIFRSGSQQEDSGIADIIG